MASFGLSPAILRLWTKISAACLAVMPFGRVVCWGEARRVKPTRTVACGRGGSVVLHRQDDDRDRDDENEPQRRSGRDPHGRPCANAPS